MIRVGEGASVPIKSKIVTLMLVRGDLLLGADSTVSGKRQLLQDCVSGGGNLYAAWTGQWRTDVFPVTAAHVQEGLG